MRRLARALAQDLKLCVEAQCDIVGKRSTIMCLANQRKHSAEFFRERPATIKDAFLAYAESLEMCFAHPLERSATVTRALDQGWQLVLAWVVLGALSLVLTHKLA